MRPDPEPDYPFIFLNADRTVIFGDAQREDRPGRMYPFEAEAGVVGILLEGGICFARLLSGLLR
jgi:hypothetical protein